MTLWPFIVTGATMIGFVVMGIAALLLIVIVVAAIHDCLRMTFRSYDLWFYDEVRGWNRKRRNKAHGPVSPL